MVNDTISGKYDDFITHILHHDYASVYGKISLTPDDREDSNPDGKDD